MALERPIHLETSLLINGQDIARLCARLGGGQGERGDCSRDLGAGVTDRLAALVRDQVGKLCATFADGGRNTAEHLGAFVRGHETHRFESALRARRWRWQLQAHAPKRHRPRRPASRRMDS
jgi:hypothetical protein